MRRTKKFVIRFCAMSLLVGAFAVHGDTLVLRDGRRLVGQVQKTDDGYVIRLKAGQLTIATAEVLTWEKTPATPATVTPATPTAVSPDTKPTSPVVPAGEKTVSDAEQKLGYTRIGELVEQGLMSLIAGEGRAALETFADARSLAQRVKLSMDPKDPMMYSLIEGLGVSYMQIGRYDIARDFIERAYNSAARGRAAVANRAIIDLVQQSIPMRGVKDVKAFLTQATEPDEQVVIVLGACLRAAANDRRLVAGELYRSANAFYETKCQELSARHDGMQLWGTEWLSSKDARRKLKSLKSGMEAYDSAASRRDDAASSLSSADRKLEAARSAHALGGSASAVSSAIDRRDRAKDNLAGAERAATAAYKEIPWPQYPDRMAPILPDAAAKLAQPAVAAATTPPTPTVIATVPASPSIPTLSRGTPAPNTPLAPPTTAPPTAVATGTASSTDLVSAPLTPTRNSNRGGSAPGGTSSATSASQRKTVTRKAVAVPVAPDLLLTSAALVEGGNRLSLENSFGDTFTPQFVRKDAESGLALLRVPGQKFRFLNLADRFTGGDIQCWGFPEVSVFNISSQSIAGNAAAPHAPAAWTISIPRHPRLTADAILDKGGNLIGIALCDRETATSSIPAVTAQQIKTFLGTDAPTATCSNPDPTGVMQLTVSRNAE